MSNYQAFINFIEGVVAIIATTKVVNISDKLISIMSNSISFKIIL